MKCDPMVRLVEKLADGEATPDEQAKAEAHLERCENCRSHYQFVRALASASEQIEWPEPPEAYWRQLPNKVAARLERERSEKPGFWEKWLTPAVVRFGAVAATLTVVVAIGVNVLRHDPEQLEVEIAQAPSSSGDAQPERRRDAEPEPAPEALEDAPSPRVGSLAAPKAAAPRAPAPRSESAPPAPAPAEPAILEEEELEEELARDAANVAALEGGVAQSAAPVPDEGRDRQPASLARAPGEAGRAAEDEELGVASEEAFAAERAIRRRAPTSARASAVAAPADCDRWRELLAEGRDTADIRYRVALCSIEEHVQEPSDERFQAAERDAKAFLALESEGDRANSMRRRIEELRR